MGDIMTPEQIELVQNSFAKIRPAASDVAKLFYNRLFQIAPQVRPMFPENMDDQGKKLMAVLGTAVQSLTNLPALVPVLEKLARNHLAYGVEEAHYDVVGEVLLWTLEQGLGDDFTEETREAWVQTYAIVSQTMCNAAYAKAA
jgi:hemoglobin-like flavoprotein